MEYNNSYHINNTMSLNDWLNATLVAESLFTSMSGRKAKLWIEINNKLTLIEDKKDLEVWFNENNITEPLSSLIASTPFELEKDIIFNINGKQKTIRITVI